MSPSPQWNHNIHYHPLILDTIPADAQRALDLGCGEGHLARELRQLLPEVTAVDVDPTSIELAREQDPNHEIDYRCDDLLTADLEPGSFDLVASVATVHHLDARTALRRMSDLVRPGGRLVVIGLARAELPADLGREVAAVLAHRWHTLTRTPWEHPSPTVWPPPETFTRMRDIANEALPGVHYRRHLLWRYSLLWIKPA